VTERSSPSRKVTKLNEKSITKSLLLLNFALLPKNNLTPMVNTTVLLHAEIVQDVHRIKGKKLIDAKVFARKNFCLDRNVT
jgi:hypothetical protein